MRDRLGRPPALLVVPAALATLLLVVPLVAMVAATNWQALPDHLASPTALDALRLSLVTSTVAIAFCLLLGLPLAWLLARVDFRGRGALRALVTVPLVLRGAARHRSWVPAMAVGVALAPLGSPFVPYPSLVASRQRPTRWRVHLPALVAAAALVAFGLESALAGTPVAHRMTAVCAVVLASVLVPVPPLDGARLTDRRAGLAAAVLLGGLTVALSVGWV